MPQEDTQLVTTTIYDRLLDISGNPLGQKLICFAPLKCSSLATSIVTGGNKSILTDNEGYFSIELIANLIYTVKLPQGDRWQFLLPENSEPMSLGMLKECGGISNQNPQFLATLEYIKNHPQQLNLDFTIEKSTTFTQEIISSNWIVEHNLGKRPHVDAYDSGGNLLWGEVEHLDENNLIFRFVPATTGILYLN